MHHDEHDYEVTTTPEPEPAQIVPEDPGRYTQGTIETWDGIIGLGLDYCSGNVTKYLCRHQRKGGGQDLVKALDYMFKVLEVAKVPRTEIEKIVRKHDF